jgi:hypothetical protein
MKKFAVLLLFAMAVPSALSAQTMIGFEGDLKNLTLNLTKTMQLRDEVYTECLKVMFEKVFSGTSEMKERFLVYIVIQGILEESRAYDALIDVMTMYMLITDANKKNMAKTVMLNRIKSTITKLRQYILTVTKDKTKPDGYTIDDIKAKAAKYMQTTLDLLGDFYDKFLPESVMDKK